MIANHRAHEATAQDQGPENRSWEPQTEQDATEVRGLRGSFRSVALSRAPQG